MKKVLMFLSVLLCGSAVWAATPTEIWQAIGSPAGISVTSVDRWDVDNTSAAGGATAYGDGETLYR